MVSGTAMVDKATSDLLIGPDWAMNMEICDIINSNPGQAKEVIKAVKKRLGHRNPKVQLLALTFLETIVKNCGAAVHQQVAEKDVLHEMVKIVKRKSEMHVRDKILVLLNAWKDAFGGPNGRFPQFYMAYAELRGMGVEFPDSPGEHDAPIFTPPQTHPVQRTGYGSPANMPARLDALMSNEQPGLSLTDIETARGRLEVLLEMLDAVNPRDRQSVKDELIVELVEQCRSTQQRVMNLVNNTSDEELLRQGLALNDDLQRVLAKHDAIASGTPLPREAPPLTTNVEQSEAKKEHPQQAEAEPASVEPVDPFIQLALPAPPTPKQQQQPSSKVPKSAADFIDLLSGDAPSATPTTSAMPSTPSTPSAPQQVISNPFESQQAFHASSEPSSFGYQQQQQQGANGVAFAQNGSAFSPTQQAYPQQQQQNYQQAQQSYQQNQQQPYQQQSYQQGYQQTQQLRQEGFGAPAAAAAGAAFSFPQNNYVAPWAMANSSSSSSSSNNNNPATSAAAAQQFSPQQQALMYGTGGGSQFPSTPAAAPWQYQQYGGGYYGAYGAAPYSEPQYQYSDHYSYQYGAGSYYGAEQQQQQQQLALVPVSAAAAPPGQRSAVSSADRLFEDLVDIQSLGSKLKKSSISS